MRRIAEVKRGVQNYCNCKTGNDVQGRDMGSEESAEEIGRDRNEDVEMDVWCYKDGHE